MDLEKICQQVIELTRNTGKFILNEKKNNTSIRFEEKGLHDFVTYVDKTSEQKLVEGLNVILPEAGYIVEEQTTT
ncbi:MAG: inositol monophosphatase family protein, partial [Bacteroidota bacterium]